MEAALGLLAVRARTRSELEQALRWKGYEEADREQTLQRLADLGYLNDGDFALGRARGLLREGRLGPAGVLHKLMGHGLSGAEAKQALALAQEELAFDPLEAARAALAKRRVGPLDDPKVQARAIRLLVGRGFSPKVARQAAQALDCADDED